MPFKSYQQWLSSDLRILVVFETVDGVVVYFAVILLLDTPAGAVNIVRYDSAHGMAHRDMLGRRKGLLRKDWFPSVPFGRVMTHAIADFRRNHEHYRKIYEAN